MPYEWFTELGGLTHIQGPLYRCPIPQSSRHVEALVNGGIRVVYSMEEEVSGNLLKGRGLDWRPHFWTDDQAPTLEQVERFLADYLALPPEVPRVVHCRAGWGRTGTAIACALMATNGWNSDQALSYYWSRVPRARPHMERNGQAAFVRAFGTGRRARQSRLDV